MYEKQKIVDFIYICWPEVLLEIFYLGEDLTEYLAKKRFYIINSSHDTADNNHLTVGNAEKCLGCDQMQLLYVRNEVYGPRNQSVLSTRRGPKRIFLTNILKLEYDTHGWKF